MIDNNDTTAILYDGIGNIDSTIKIIFQNSNIVIVHSSIGILKNKILYNNDIKLGSKVYWAQPIVTKHSLELYINSGYVNRITDRFFYIDKPAIAGGSGSGIYDKNSELVGILEGYTEIEQQKFYTIGAKLDSIKQYLDNVENIR